MAIGDKDGQLPLHYSVQQNLPTVVRALLNSPSTDPNAVNAFGWSPLHLAAKYGFAEVVKMLLEVKEIDVNLPNKG